MFLRRLLLQLLLESCPDFPHWWIMTWRWKPNRSSPPQIVFGGSVYYSHRRQTRTSRLWISVTALSQQTHQCGSIEKRLIVFITRDSKVVSASLLGTKVLNEWSLYDTFLNFTDLLWTKWFYPQLSSFCLFPPFLFLSFSSSPPSGFFFPHFSVQFFSKQYILVVFLLSLSFDLTNIGATVSLLSLPNLGVAGCVPRCLTYYFCPTSTWRKNNVWN